MSRLNPISEERKQERKNAVIKELKSLIFPTVLLLIIGAGILFIMKYQAKEKPAEIIPQYNYEGDGEPVVLENEYLKFEMDTKLTTFDITDKRTGVVWHSVPEDGANDPIAIAEEKNKLQSTMLVTFSDESGLDTVYDSYAYSVLNGVYNVTADENSVRVDYSLGKIAKKFLIPPVITAKRFKSFLEQMDDMDKENVQSLYRKVDIKKLSKKDQENKDALIAQYPIMETEPIYLLTANLKDSPKKILEKCFAKVGYTEEDYINDSALDVSEAEDDNLIFNVSMIYRLEGDDLVVEVPFDSIMCKSESPIYTITPLPFFGAGDSEEDGYILLPEGGGSIIDFNNGKLSQSVYYANMYGWDMCLRREALVHNTMANMNVFGLAKNGASYLCMLEDGASYAGIKADISGRYSSYNYANSTFTVKTREKYEFNDNMNKEIYVYLKNLPDETISMRYSFVDSDDYVDMAKDYQKYLLEKYPEYFVKNDDSSTPMLIEAVGAVDKVKQIVGVPVSRPLALTTYEEAAELIKDIKAQGVDNLSVKYTGWCNGGVKQKYLDNVVLINALGSKKDLKNLAKTAAEEGVDLYLDGITNYEYNSNLFNGFFSYTDAAKFLSKERAALYEYSDVTYSAREGLDPYFLLHGDVIKDMTSTLLDVTKEYNTGVSFADMGMDVSSDFYKKKYTSREDAKAFQEETFKKVSDAGQNIMINAGNAYAVPYADMVANMDLKGSEYTVLDRTVPFYQIALHGYVDYTGYPINTCGNEVEELLYSAEYGAGLNFSIMKESAFTLQKTLYTEYYASDYDAWGGRMMDIYNRYNKELGHTFNQEIVDHEYMTSEVTRTTYEDGTDVYVNYSFNPVTCDGVTVPARDYMVVR